MNNLYKTAQALQLTSSKKWAQTEGKKKMMIHSDYKKEPHKTNQTVQQHVLPILLHTCVQLY
jgi:hypothetical protein